MDAEYFKSVCISALTLIVGSFLPFLSVSADTTAPRIIHEIINTDVPASQPYTLTAVVTDEEGVSEVVLNFKSRNAPGFESLPMVTKPGLTEYTITLPASALAEPGIDYFITATDTSGNQQFRGFDFDPLRLDVFVPVELQSGGSEKAESAGVSKVWYVVGAVALLGLVAGASGGSGGGTQEGAPSQTFVLTR